MNIPWRCRFGWHIWSQWSAPTAGVKVSSNPLLGIQMTDAATIQQRVCDGCGTAQRREVK